MSLFSLMTGFFLLLIKSIGFHPFFFLLLSFSLTRLDYFSSKFNLTTNLIHNHLSSEVNLLSLTLYLKIFKFINDKSFL